jgi:acetyl esterase
VNHGRGITLDPAAQALLELMRERGVPSMHTLPVDAARAMYRERRAVTQPSPPAVDEVRELTLPGPAGALRARLYRPRSHERRAPALVYFHGGGWVIGDLDTHDTLCRELALGSGCAIVAIDYRLGPEHRFPAAADDAIAAARWVAREAPSLGLDATRLAVGGDSAGGNLAAVVALTARDHGDLLLRWQLLIYPATDLRCTAPSHARNGDGYLLTTPVIHWFRGHYLATAAQQSDWRASPLLAADHSRLPPALIVSAGFDPLVDEARLYAEALSAAGTTVTSICFERQLHGFITMGRVIPEARAAVALCATELRRALT